jgi:RNA polymerase sigma-70 factor (sigma-E family)
VSRAEDFDEFVGAASGHLLRSAYLFVGDSGAAEDLLQDVLERMYVRWPHISDPYPYAQRAIAHRASNRWRTRSRKPEVPLGDRDVAVDGHSLAEAHDVMAALAALPRGQRAVIVLRYFEGLTIEQTAQALGCSLGTVKSQTARALPRLKALLTLAEESC